MKSEHAKTGKYEHLNGLCWKIGSVVRAIFLLTVVVNPQPRFFWVMFVRIEGKRNVEHGFFF